MRCFTKIMFYKMSTQAGRFLRFFIFSDVHDFAFVPILLLGWEGNGLGFNPLDNCIFSIIAAKCFDSGEAFLGTGSY